MDAEAESGGVFKNFSYLEQEAVKVSSVSSYTDIMRNNEDLLASHMGHVATGGSRQGRILCSRIKVWIEKRHF